MTSTPRALAKRFYVILARPTATAGARHAVLAEHLAWLDQLERSGRLFLAGPFVAEDGTSTGGGMFVVRAASLAAAETLAAGDPYYRDGYRTYTISPWRLDQGAFRVGVSFSSGSYSFD